MSQVDYTGTGREDYVTAAGRTIQRKYFYYSRAQWQMLYRLSKDAGVSLGKMLFDLAEQERDRRAADYQSRLDSIS
jgi:hypothetical protein